MCKRAGQKPRLETLFDIGTLFSRNRAVVSTDQLFAGQFVETRGQTLCQAAIVDEEQSRAVPADHLEEAWIDCGPDGCAAFVAGAGYLAGGLVKVASARPVHVLHRHDDLQIEFTCHTGIGDAYWPVAAEIAGHFFERALGGGKADPLGRAAGECFEAFERKGEVCASLGRRHGVDLIDDDGAHRAQDFARTGGEHQVERFWSSDEDIGRVLSDVLAIFAGGITGTSCDGDFGDVEAFPGSGDAQSSQGSAKVTLDIVGKCLKGRYVQDRNAG